MKSRLCLLSLILLLSLSPGCGDKKGAALLPNREEKEPNDSAAQALAVANGAIVKGFIAAPKDQDWFKIAIPTDSTAILRSELTGVIGLNLKMELFDSQNEKLVEADKNKEAEGEIIANYGLATGDYFLRVRELWTEGKERKFNDTTAYHLRIYLSAIGPEVEFESNNKAIRANLVQSEQPIRGYISPYKDVDWFKILLPEFGNQYLELQLSGLDNVALQLEVYDPIEALLLKRNSIAKGEGVAVLNLGIKPELEFYYIAIHAGAWHSNEESTYQLAAYFKSYEGQMEFEPNDKLVRASPIASGDTITGYFDTPDDADWYQLQCLAPSAQIARIEVMGVPKINLKLTLFNANEEQILCVNETGEMENEIITNIGLKSNTNYFLKAENVARSANPAERYAIYLNIDRLSAFEEFEPNNEKETATLMELDTNIRGYIHPIGDIDFYKLELTARQISGLKIMLDGIIKVNTDMVLYNADMQKIAEANSRQSEETETLTVDLTPGIYFIKIYDNDGKESNYRDLYELMILSSQ